MHPGVRSDVALEVDVRSFAYVGRIEAGSEREGHARRVQHVQHPRVAQLAVGDARVRHPALQRHTCNIWDGTLVGRLAVAKKFNKPSSNQFVTGIA